MWPGEKRPKRRRSSGRWKSRCSAKKECCLPFPSLLIGRKRKGYRELFKGKYRHRTLILAMAWIFQTLGFYGFGSWVPTLLVQNGIMLDKSLLYSTLITIGAPLGALLGAMISDRFERKWNLVASSLFIAISVFFYSMTVNPLFLIAFGFLVNLIERTSSSNLYTYTSEMYPTSIRGSGYGLTYGLGRFSNVLGPMLISLLAARVRKLQRLRVHLALLGRFSDRFELRSRHQPAQPG
ncbi:MFS transporter [Paenibacillus thiaminolyticus]|nr:MFS transporter [Paenibacillus thiaminolyticus]WCR29994.1 MFS transporter [Paenibacillus thiaminolyticus]